MRGWLRIAVGLLTAAALATVPVWWEAAGTLLRAGPLAPAWPWLATSLFAIVVTAVTLAVPRPSRRRRLVRRMDRFERSFLRRLAGTAGVPDPEGWRRELDGQRAGAAERLAGRAGRRPRAVRHACELLEGRWQTITAAVAERQRGEAGSGVAGVQMAGLVDAALSDACGTGTPAAARAPAAHRPVSPASGGPGRGATPEAASAPPAPPPPQPREHAKPEAASEAAAADDRGAPVTVYEAGKFAQEVQKARESVALEDGVYRIREQVYGTRPETRRSLRRIAEGVITDDKIARLTSAGRRREVRTPVTGDGLSYDRLLAQYPAPEADETRMRILDGQRVALDADAAVLLVSGARGYEATLVAAGALAGGTPVSTLRTMTLSAGDALHDDYMRDRRYLLAGPENRDSWSLPFAADRVALVPATLDGGRVYVLFTASEEHQPRTSEPPPWSAAMLIERLNLHT